MHEVSLITTLPSEPYQLAIAYASEEDATKLPAEISPSQLSLYKAEAKTGSIARVPMGTSVGLIIGGALPLNEFVATAVRNATSSAPLVIDLRGKSESVVAVAEVAMLASKTRANQHACQ